MDKTVGIEEDVLHKSAIQIYRLLRRTELKKNKDTGVMDNKLQLTRLKLDELFKKYSSRQSSASKKSGKLNNSKAATAVNKKQRNKKKSRTKRKNTTESTDNVRVVPFTSSDLMSTQQKWYTELQKSPSDQSQRLAIRPPSPVFVNVPSISYDSCQTEIEVKDEPIDNFTTQTESEDLGSPIASEHVSLVPSDNFIAPNCTKTEVKDKPLNTSTTQVLLKWSIMKRLYRSLTK